LLAVLFPLFSGCTPAARELVPASVLTPEDSVYLDVLGIYARADRRGVVLLSDSTEGPIRSPRDSTGLQAFGSFVDGLPDELVSSFKMRGQERVAVKREILLRYAPVIRAQEADEGELIEDPEEGLFRLPRGGEVDLLTLSRVGFDSGRKQALLHVYWVCGPRCGSTRLNLLRRGEDGRWEIERSERGWVF
jgi:hypothetical protein